MFQNKTARPAVSHTDSRIARPASGWTKVKLETAPASNLADIAEADVVLVDDANAIPNPSE